MNQPCCPYICRNMNSKTVKENCISAIYPVQAATSEMFNRFPSRISISCGHFKTQIFAWSCLLSLLSRRVERTCMCMCMTVTVLAVCDAVYLDIHLLNFRGKRCLLSRRFSWRHISKESHTHKHSREVLKPHICLWCKRFIGKQPFCGI